MINLNVLLNFRTKEELINYFKAMGKNITEEEIEALKKNYKIAQENDNILNLQQLDEIAGGVLVGERAFSSFRSPKNRFAIHEANFEELRGIFAGKSGAEGMPNSHIQHSQEPNVPQMEPVKGNLDGSMKADATPEHFTYFEHSIFGFGFGKEVTIKDSHARALFASENSQHQVDINNPDVKALVNTYANGEIQKLRLKFLEAGDHQSFGNYTTELINNIEGRIKYFEGMKSGEVTLTHAGLNHMFNKIYHKNGLAESLTEGYHNISDIPNIPKSNGKPVKLDIILALPTSTEDSQQNFRNNLGQISSDDGGKATNASTATTRQSEETATVATTTAGLNRKETSTPVNESSTTTTTTTTTTNEGLSPQEQVGEGHGNLGLYGRNGGLTSVINDIVGRPFTQETEKEPSAPEGTPSMFASPFTSGTAAQAAQSEQPKIPTAPPADEINLQNNREGQPVPPTFEGLSNPVAPTAPEGTPSMFGSPLTPDTTAHTTQSEQPKTPTAPPADAVASQIGLPNNEGEQPEALPTPATKSDAVDQDAKKNNAMLNDFESDDYDDPVNEVGNLPSSLDIVGIASNNASQGTTSPEDDTNSRPAFNFNTHSGRSYRTANRPAPEDYKRARFVAASLSEIKEELEKTEDEFVKILEINSEPECTLDGIAENFIQSIQKLKSELRDQKVRYDAFCQQCSTKVQENGETVRDDVFAGEVYDFIKGFEKKAEELKDIVNEQVKLYKTQLGEGKKKIDKQLNLLPETIADKIRKDKNYNTIISTIKELSEDLASIIKNSAFSEEFSYVYNCIMTNEYGSKWRYAQNRIDDIEESLKGYEAELNFRGICDLFKKRLTEISTADLKFGTTEDYNKMETLITKMETIKDTTDLEEAKSKLKELFISEKDYVKSLVNYCVQIRIRQNEEFLNAPKAKLGRELERDLDLKEIEKELEKLKDLTSENQADAEAQQTMLNPQQAAPTAPTLSMLYGTPAPAVAEASTGSELQKPFVFPGEGSLTEHEEKTSENREDLDYFTPSVLQNVFRPNGNTDPTRENAKTKNPYGSVIESMFSQIPVTPNDITQPKQPVAAAAAAAAEPDPKPLSRQQTVPSVPVTYSPVELTNTAITYDTEFKLNQEKMICAEVFDEIYKFELLELKARLQLRMIQANTILTRQFVVVDETKLKQCKDFANQVKDKIEKDYISKVKEIETSDLTSDEKLIRVIELSNTYTEDEVLRLNITNLDEFNPLGDLDEND